MLLARIKESLNHSGNDNSDSKFSLKNSGLSHCFLFKGILDRAFFSNPESQAKKMKMKAKTEKTLNMIWFIGNKDTKKSLIIDFEIHRNFQTLIIYLIFGVSILYLIFLKNLMLILGIQI